MAIVYGIYQNTDLTEGRGVMVLREPLYESQAAAEKALKGVEGVFGTEQGKEIRPLVLATDAEIAAGISPGEQSAEAIRALALSRLSEAEKKVLGL